MEDFGSDDSVSLQPENAKSRQLEWDENDLLWFNGRKIGGLVVRPYPDGTRDAKGFFMGAVETERLDYAEARQALEKAARDWLGLSSPSAADVPPAGGDIIKRMFEELGFAIVDCPSLPPPPKA